MGEGGGEGALLLTVAARRNQERKGVHTSFGGIVTGNGILAYLLSASNVNQTTVYTINMMY